MLLCIFEDDAAGHLQPLTHTRACYMLRAGRRTLLESTISRYQATGVVLHCRSHLRDVVREETNLPVNRIPADVGVLFVNGRIIDPDGAAAATIREASGGSEPLAFMSGPVLAAVWIPAGSASLSVHADAISADSLPAGVKRIDIDCAVIDRLWHLLDHIEASIDADLHQLSRGYNIFERPGADISPGATLVEEERIFVAPQATVGPGAILDASSGAIIIDAGAVVEEHAVLRGPVAIGERSMVKVGSVIASSAVGLRCKVAGEIKGSIVHDFTNKAHPGYLGDSVLGSWCNLGADTNTSNLRNDYGEISLVNDLTRQAEKSGRIFAGLFMGDHSKSGINTMFNTGSVIGVSCNLYGAGYQPRYLPSFLWGSPQDRYVTYRFDKAVRVARTVMARREQSLSAAAEALLRHIFDATEAARAEGPKR